MSPATVNRIFDVQSNGIDRVLGGSVSFGLGYALTSENDSGGINSGKVCYWGGWVDVSSHD